MTPQLERLRGPLSGDQVAAISALAAAAEAVDGEAPLSESFLLSLVTDDSSHILSDGGSSGYAQVMDGGACEFVVHPDHRGRGLGSALLAAAIDLGARSVWAHGSLPAARAFAQGHGLRVLRELHLMTRPLTEADTADPDLPTWIEITTFAARPDLAALTDLNAAAFASHPEQGALTMADIASRMAQSWFDPAGLIFLLDRGDPRRGPIAFHWTKRAASADAAHAEGEVYVVGVHPAYQGRGLSRALTLLGTAYLARNGVHLVHLYVDGDNAAALGTYTSLGFQIAHTDTQLAIPQ